MIHRLAPALFAIVVGTLSATPVLASAVARFDCRSFGQNVSSGGSITIKYATPMMCWASKTTVGGVAVNETGWVPEVFFDWSWDDTSLGSVSRGGLAMDLGKSVGVVAAHAFKPTQASFNESCGGAANNSLHAVRLTVTAVENGQQTSSTATLNVCVENPQTTWPNPVAFCDDSNCADDPGLPPGTVHGGNRPDLAGILRWCETNGSSRVLLEGGVTFSTGTTDITVGSNPCLIESYPNGSSRAKLRFTASSSTPTAIEATSSACAGYRLHNVTVAGSGTGPTLIGGAANTGCYVILDSNATNVAGEEFSSITTVDPSGISVQSEGYYIKFDYKRQSDSGRNAAYIFGNYTAFVGGEISGIDTAPNNNEHNIRLPQWKYVVIDSMLLKDQEAGRHLITLRQDCGGTGSCPNSPSASMFAITRNELRADENGTIPVQICNSGSGAAEQTKCYDGDLIRNLGSWNALNTKRELVAVESGTTGSDTARYRVFQNAADFSTQDSSTYERLVTFSGTRDTAVVGNVVIAVGGSQTYSIANVSGNAVVKNNVCYANGPGGCDPFPGYNEGPHNIIAATDPFDGDPGEPATAAGFGFLELRITGSSALANAGTLDAVGKDPLGTARAGVPDAGIFEASSTSGGGGGGGVQTPPQAPVLL